MTYLKHLINWTRLKAALWVFIAGALASIGLYFSQTNILTVTWLDVKVAIITAVISQLTKAFTNYTAGYPIPD